MISLQNILNSEGQEFLDNLLNKEVIVTEKLNAATLSFQKRITSEMDLNRKLTFYKGSGSNKKEITVADRVMTNFYSNGMTYLNNLSKIIIDKIPGNWTFVCKYFPNHQPSFINYSVLPKNNLVLSCIITSGGTKIDNEDDLRPWAEMFDIAFQEPIFKGYLSEYQKDQLNDYLKNNTSKESFSRFIITLLNPNLTHSLYQNDGFDAPIDGFIFKFISDDGITKPISAKLIDPYMTNLIMKNKSNKGFKDNTDVLLSDFTVFMTSQDMDSIILKSDDDAQRYLELFYKLFNRYIKYRKSLLDDFDVDTNDIVKEAINTEFDVDLDKISNETTKKLLKENPEFKSIFKTLLGSFKSKKPDDYKSLVMSPGVVRLFNEVVDKINDKVSTREEEKDMSFSSYLDAIHKKDINTLDIKNAPENVQKTIKTPELNIDAPHLDQAMSFADFKKQDEKVEDEKKEKKELKSIEDMIKDLKKSITDIKSELKDTKNEVKDEVKDAKDAAEKSDKSDNKDDEKKDKKSDKQDDGDKSSDKSDDSDEKKNDKDKPEKEDSKDDNENSKDDDNNNDDNGGDDKNDNPLASL